MGGVALLYYLVRGFARSKRAEAVANAERVVDIEKRLGLYVEPEFQQLTTRSLWQVHLWNIVYFWGHLPLLASFAAWMWHADRLVYRRLRRVFLVSQAIGALGYFLFPVAPPRLMPPEYGFVDTLVERHEFHYQRGSLKLFLNEYAAMPSLHFGWSLLMTAGLWCIPSWWARLAGMLSPLASLASIVATANHWDLDAVGGAAVMVVSFLTARRLPRPR